MPEISRSFPGITSDAWYPAGNVSWTEEARKSYGGLLTWKKICVNSEHSKVYGAAIEPTCTETGYETGLCCSKCDYTFQEIIPAKGHSYVNRTCSNCGFGEPLVSGSLEGELGESAGTWTLDYKGTFTVFGNDSTPFFYYFGSVYETDEIPWYTYRSMIRNQIVTEGTTEIDGFQDCDQLADVTLPDTLCTIGINAFYGFEALNSIELPDSVSIIEEGAFQNCSNLTNINMPEALHRIEKAAFKDCSKLTSVSFAADVERIGEEAFYQCTGLESVSLPSGLVRIDDSAFYSCTKLSGISIPEGTTTIGNDAFSNCTALKELHFSASVTSIGENAFSNCDSLSKVRIPEGITMLKAGIFSSCDSLKSVTILPNVAMISENVFYGSSLLNEIFFMGDPPLIANNAFSEVTATVYYPQENQNWTDEVMLNYGGNLTWEKICVEQPYVETDDPAKDATCTETGLGPGVMCTVCGFMTVPQEIIPATGHSYDDSWDQDCGVCSFVRASVGGTWGEDVNVILDNGILTVSGTGEMARFSTAPWLVYADQIKKVVVKDGVTAVSEDAFRDCRNLTDVALADSVKLIATNAFINCTALKSMILPANLERIHSWAFMGCTALESVTIPATVIENSCECFRDCTGLKTVRFNGEYVNGVRVFMGVSADAYYPLCSKTWTENNRQACADSADLKWIPYGSHSFVSGKCTECGQLDASDLKVPTIKGSNDAASGKPKLTWSKVACADIYRIYRSASMLSGYTSVGSTRSAGYIDTTAVAGKTYHYKIKAVAESSGAVTDFSNMVS